LLKSLKDGELTVSKVLDFLQFADNMHSQILTARYKAAQVQWWKFVFSPSIRTQVNELLADEISLAQDLRRLHHSVNTVSTPQSASSSASSSDTPPKVFRTRMKKIHKNVRDVAFQAAITPIATRERTVKHIRKYAVDELWAIYEADSKHNFVNEMDLFSMKYSFDELMDTIFYPCEVLASVTNNNVAFLSLVAGYGIYRCSSRSISQIRSRNVSVTFYQEKRVPTCLMCKCYLREPSRS
jgi:hypothetical protein